MTDHSGKPVKERKRLQRLEREAKERAERERSARRRALLSTVVCVVGR